jgi:hypothetical protein
MKTGPEAFGAGIGAYMSPYQQQVTDIQKREAARQSDIQGQGQQAKATQAGAFGGYREAIERSERERNLGQQMDDIQAKGAQSAFDRATSQYNTGQQQTQDVARLQNSMGTQQQANAQQNLNQQYQDFLNQKQQPYKDLGFMKDILSGSGSSSAQTQYGVSPNNSAQTAGLITAGLGALGKKDGGTIEGYAEGGIAGAPNDIELQSMLTKMSDEQLQQLAKSGKYDPQIIQQELQRRAQIRAGGLASLPSAQEEYADGGIIGFADEGAVPKPQEDEYGYLPGETIGERLKRRGSGIGAALASGARWLANPGARNQAPAGMDSKGFQASDKDRTPVDTPTAAGAPMPTMQVSETKAPSIGAADAKPNARTNKAATPGLPGILKTKESATPPIAPPTAGTGFVADDYESIVRRRNELAKEGNAEIDSAYKEQQDRLKAERDEIRGRGKQNINEALIRAGLGMMVAGGQGKSTLTALGEGATQGFGAYQDAKRLDQAALKANQQAEDTLRQAKRAERSGNMDRTTALYAQYRNEKTTAAQLEMQAQQLAAQIKHQEESLKVQQQLANQQGQYQRGMLANKASAGNPAKMDLATLKQQAALIESELKNTTLQYTDPDRYALLLQNKAMVQDALARQPGGVTMTGASPPGATKGVKFLGFE